MGISAGMWAVWKAAYGGGGSGDGDDDGGKKDDGREEEEENKRALSDADLPAAIGVLLRTFLHAVLIQCAVSAIDYAHYGRLLSPTLNIFMYNAAGGGDELYGVEPLSYYVKNLALNFNVVAILGAGALPALLALRWAGDQLRRGGKGDALTSSSSKEETVTATSLRTAAWILAPLYVWLLVVVPRPHKEERFLFPIYPALCLGAAWVADEAGGLIAAAAAVLLGRYSGEGSGAEDKSGGSGGNVGGASRRPARTAAASSGRIKALVGALIFVPAALLSASRSAALSANYSAPLAVYDALYRRIVERRSARAPSLKEEEEERLLACVGGEWYRYPSSYHLPPDVQLGFLKSSFDGQLPQPFAEYGSREESANAKGRRRGKFNDLNEEETERYVDIAECSYVIELVDNDNGGSDSEDDSVNAKKKPECVEYMESSKERGRWSEVARYDFLDAERTSFLHRVLYVPFLRGDRAVMKSYALFERAR
uniref:Mannosyltransferase n=1 Tax=Odontella aurita TaxID=265563 RepID=A0A7S4K9Z2_9STRA